MEVICNAKKTITSESLATVSELAVYEKADYKASLELKWKLQ